MHFSNQVQTVFNVRHTVQHSLNPLASQILFSWHQPLLFSCLSTRLSNKVWRKQCVRAAFLLAAHWPSLCAQRCMGSSISEITLYGWWHPICITLLSQQVTQAHKWLITSRPQTVCRKETGDNMWFYSYSYSYFETEYWRFYNYTARGGRLK